MKLINNNQAKTNNSKYLGFIPSIKQEKAKKLTTITLTLTSSIILLIFAIKPTFSTIANLQRQLKDNQELDMKLQEKIDNLSTLERKYAQIEPDLEIIYNAVPKTPKAVLLVGQIQALAKDTSLSLNNFQISEVGISSDSLKQSKTSYFSFSFTATGNYENMISFLDNLSNAQRIVTFSESGITKNTTSGSNNLSISVKGDAYFKP